MALASIDTGNPVSNVIPADGRAVFNIRFNDLHTSADLREWASRLMNQELAGTECTGEIEWQVSGESFLTSPGREVDVVADTVAEMMQRRPALTTGGGTSDARFIKNICPVVELGLVGDTMHQIDERVPVADIRALSGVYLEILRRYFAG